MGGPALINGVLIYEFDNFEYTPFTYKGKVWTTSEHAYQASKFTDEKYIEEIRHASSGIEAWKLGQSTKYKIKTGFDRVQSMKEILREKFSIPRLRELLNRTTGYISFPGSDSFWGTCEGSGGQNVLGKILMELRDNK
jgi:ribA/ribD-fused uncharacterized protein